MCRRILDSGLSPGLHLYTLNMERAGIAILENLGLLGDQVPCVPSFAVGHSLMSAVIISHHQLSPRSLSSHICVAHASADQPRPLHGGIGERLHCKSLLCLETTCMSGRGQRLKAQWH